MKRLKPLGLALISVLTLASLASTQANAATFEALPERPEFLIKNIGTITFKSLGKTVLPTCSAVTGTGRFTSKRLGEIELKATECADAGLGIKCTGLSDTTAGNITIKGEFHIRHLLKSTGGEPSENAVLVILLSPLHYNCSIVLDLWTGCMASDDLLGLQETSAVNKLLADILIFLLEGSAGDPAVTEIDADNSLGMEACVLLFKENPGTAESAVLKGTLLMENCKPNSCTFLIDLTGIF